jgi:hypothetical protein
MRYPSGGAQLLKRMAKIKLELRFRTDAEVRDLALAHKMALTQAPGNAQFPTPDPTPAVFDAKVTAYGAKLSEIDLAEAHLAALRAEKDRFRSEVELLLNQRANYVQNASGGEEAKIQNAAFGVQSLRTPTNSLVRPGNLVAAMTEKPGDIRLTCSAVARAKSYIWECRLHEEGAVDGPWAQFKISARSSITATGLVSGKKYAFRVRALGPNEVESPWSDEAVCMAA